MYWKSNINYHTEPVLSVLVYQTHIIQNYSLDHPTTDGDKTMTHDLSMWGNTADGSNESCMES